MAWKSITLTLLNSLDAEKVEQHLLDLDAVAVSYTDAGDEPILEPALNTTPLWSKTNLNAIFESETYLEDIKMSLNDTFGDDVFKVVEEKVLEDKAWEREWLEHFRPMKFGERLWICPESMQIPAAQQSVKNVIVDMDPGMAFGTGTHETTALCLEWLDAANVRKKDILDYGSGSGILAIAALKLGAKHATCLDIDIQAIEASLANAERNNVEQNLRAYLPNDSDWSKDETFDIILANILAIPLISIVQDVRRRLRRGGQIVLSGILATQAEKVSSVYQTYFNMDAVKHKGDWVLLSGRLKTPSEMLGEEECVTICPNCDESFIVSAEDLDLADGEVRCGECDTIFFAIDFIDPDPDSIPANPDGSFNTNKVPKAHLITGMWMHNKGKLVPITATQSALSDSESPQIEETPDSPVNDDLNTGKIPKAHSITGMWPVDQEALIKHVEQTEVNQVNLETQALANNDYPSTDEIEIPVKAAPTNNETENKIKSEPAEDLNKPDANEVKSSADDISPAEQMHALNQSTPMDVEELSNLQAGKNSKRNWKWALLSLLAVLVLILQTIHHQRNELAIHPSFGDPIQNIYKKLNLAIEPNWNLDAYSINASSVSLNPLDPKQLVASFNLSNTASHAQVFPIIRLSLFDRWRERIAYRDLSVQDYSPQDFKDKNLLSARGRIEVRVVIADPGSQALDFSVDVCLPKGDVIRCKEKTE